ncbi:unnamed protein product [Cylicocyclus nassatus]|uniref:Uncharacterized protein n=1 Tax=Cylicocyclus nassatus TaxID=53992 RepID=A0AA36MDK2_CYLNA|nr:unnamed protein product [Cylicocyclus nassatus]
MVPLDRGNPALQETIQLIRYFIITDPCEVGLPPIVCLCLRTPASVCMISFTLFQFLLIVERAVAVWKHQQYGSYGPHIGYISTFLCLFISVVATSWILQKGDLNERQAFCSAATTHTKERVEMISFMMCGINITTLVGLLVLTMFNKSAKKRRRFDLHSSYQFRENADVLDIMLPLSIFEALCYTAFTFSNGIITMFHEQLSTVAYRTLFTASYLVPFYTLISPTILWFIIKRLQKMKVIRMKKITTAVKDEKEAYFNLYTQMWSQAATVKVAA